MGGGAGGLVEADGVGGAEGEGEGARRARKIM